MTLFKNITLLFCAAALAACASGPQITLQPADVPSLYGDISTLAVEVPGVEEVSTAAAIQQEAAQAEVQGVIQTVEQEARNKQIAQVGEAVTQGVDEQCTAMRAEIEKLDAGLGAPALESSPSAPRTGMQKTGKTLYDLGVGTLMGQLEIFRQTKRAIFGDAEKERLRDEALERGNTRRAYLLGYANAMGCGLEDASGVEVGEESSTESQAAAAQP
ncbi:MAG: hypothetical protein KJP25_05755 [Gammaproteobacteria bacterium]|nr:hypothetical protein [Gammaproteobacteria bacterium]NND40004.1 hypothetical protein [Pseudomonadales bacterium]MBT8151350.1 hypothetical protein [Gammaproteobacteria bacterium]NNL11215.1 hypothetical protein [Pseudomonadales bacterium]NNM12250.1 hypothetical protein [Pseudomonadales bacterium]